MKKLLQKFPVGCSEVRYKKAIKMKIYISNRFAILVIWSNTFSNHSSA